MQLLNPPQPDQFQSVENAIQSQRLARYFVVAGTTDKATLFRWYMWNISLCEAFYFPLQIAEIVTRNAIHRALIFRLGERWFENTTFLYLLSPSFDRELTNCIAGEVDQHRSALTAHHICSSLSFGFWEHLATKRFDRLLWNRGIRHNFPNAPASPKARAELRTLIESVRHWRNRIAHHKAIFDKLPSKKLQDTLMLIRWVCNDTADWVTSVSTVQAVINARPNV